ncbi:MAG: hypothetical protein GY842_20260 [bacterium]|nr:hypothetical protein [bacterium]
MIDAEAHYHFRLEVFSKELVSPGGIVFVGSSHLEWFDTDRFLPGYHIVNRGIASDRLGIGERGILHRLDVSVFDCHPSFVLFQNGINDLGELARRGTPPLERIFKCADQVISRIREGLPEVPLVIANEMPTTGRFANCAPLVLPYNAHLRRVAERYGCGYADLYTIVVSDAAELRSELTYDGLHLNDQGYALLAEHVKQVLPVP